MSGQAFQVGTRETGILCLDVIKTTKTTKQLLKLDTENYKIRLTRAVLVACVFRVVLGGGSRPLQLGSWTTYSDTQ